MLGYKLCRWDFRRVLGRVCDAFDEISKGLRNVWIAKSKGIATIQAIPEVLEAILKTGGPYSLTEGGMIELNLGLWKILVK